MILINRRATVLLDIKIYERSRRLKLQKDIIAEKQKELEKLQNQSDQALDLVTSTINGLATVNEKIDVTLSEINEAKANLQSTEDDLQKTKEHNIKAIEKFRNIIE